MGRLGLVSRMAHWLRGEHDDGVALVEPVDAAPVGSVAADDESFGPAGVQQWPTVHPERLAREASGGAEAKMQELAQRFTRASDALLEMRDGLRGVNDTLAEVPEAMRAQTRFLTAINDRLEASEMHQREMLVLSRDLPHSNLAQVRALERTNSLIDEAMKTVGPLAIGFNRLAGTMESLSEASERHLMCLGILSERQERALREQRADFERHHKMVVAILSGVGVVALAGLVIAVCLLLR